ncbi:MAG: cupredoxin domain-containing protein [Flavobacteriales bacterium]|nr:cupredoxin domain-containing protein [Flavobacteriales bacterium]
MTKHDHKVIKLTQTPGEFNKKELKLKAGEPYVFEVTNKGVDHAVGFVIAPKGKTDKENHIANAYVQKVVEEGQTQSSKEVVLEKGEYVFFCPMNPTPQYRIVVN